MGKENKKEENTRTVRSLLGETFYVPKYQRGYRWTKKQVEDLLNDIYKFKPDEEKNPWYCLQPLVVKKENGMYRLIDGQQRLTTIKLILRCLNTRFPYDEQVELFTVNYETREKYGDWSGIVEDKNKAEENIDFLHIYDSYQIINGWMIEQKKNSEEFKIACFREKILHSCKFIWYDIDQGGQNKDTEESVFIRLNDGKIPLTNSELIKALFLNSSNFAKDNNEDEIRLRQLEIATQWDIIEQELSDNEFWCFINGKENTVNPRIEYLFDIIAKKDSNNTDKDFTFRFFQSKFEENEQKNGDKIKFINEEWEGVLNTYLIFKEWYKDRDYYHRVGYLLCMNYHVGNLISDYKTNDKDSFKEKLHQEIKALLDWDGDEESAQYQKPGLVRGILLLHNVITMQRQKNDMSRFSFRHYIGAKKKGWDIEHIHARAENPPKKEEHRKDWLKEIKYIIKDGNIKTKIDEFSDWTYDDAFSELFNKINQYFEKNSELDDENFNDLSNLALLDAATNRGYGNEFYPQKRKVILEKDKAGTFIPVCTKKVFLKYYTEEPPNMTFWGNADREAYLEDIKEKLSDYIKYKEYEQ